ncbi:MAG TPA: substrate-binding domain-containing protein [Candidatus Krumholzibacteriaceae bacterium]|nr:substrate-binding domain-containing protein [Candidatus Krumholzibacteriaceae bacterium]
MDKKIVGATALILVVGLVAYSFLAKPREEAVAVSGAFALYPLMIEWSEQYKATHPNVKFEISAGGAGKGMTDALSELVDIGMVSREIYQAEIDKGAFWVAVARDAVVVTVSGDNPVLSDLLAKGVTVEKLRGVFITGEITTWGQLVDRPEVTDGINVYTRSDACGAAATIAKYMGYNQEDLLGVGIFGDPGLAEAVKTDPLSIGYNNVNYAYDMESGRAVEGVSAVPLDIDGNGLVDQDEDFYDERDKIITAIRDGTYPSPPARDLYLVTKSGFQGATLDFVRWVLTEGQGYAEASGYVSVSEAAARDELAKLEG